MYNVLDVAIYVINYAHDADCGESMYTVNHAYHDIPFSL